MPQVTSAKRGFRHQLLLLTEMMKTAFGLLSVYPASAHSCRCQTWADRTIRGQTKIECNSRFDTSTERVGHRMWATNLESSVLEKSNQMVRLAISIGMMRACAATCDKATYQVDSDPTENDIFITSRRIFYSIRIVCRIPIEFAALVRSFIVLQALRFNESFYRLRN